MIGQWKVTTSKFEYQFRALTYIDAIIDLPEVITVDNARSQIVFNVFEDHWLSCYPKSRKCVHDNGNEFLGPKFLQMLWKNKIVSVPTTVKTPQSHAMVERLHQTFKTAIAISLQKNPPVSYDEVATLIQRKCAAAQLFI